MAEELICDFCSAPKPVWDYPCRTFEVDVEGFKLGSDGHWAACDVCYLLIETRNMRRLHSRSLATFFGLEDTDELPFPMEHIAFRAYSKFLNELHTKFFYNRTDEPRRIVAT